jgi:hypothetical protein
MSTRGRREVIASGVTSTPPAITTTMLHLCSARRCSAGNYVMAVARSFRPEQTTH